MNEEQEETKQYLTPPFLLASGESVTLPILFDDYPEGKYAFIVSFEDMEGRFYEQLFSINHQGSDNYSFTPINYPVLKVR